MLILLAAGCSEESDGFTIDRVDIQAELLPDGDLYVEELYTYTFRGQYDGMVRTIGDYENIEYFEAYLPPANKQLGEFAYEDGTLLETTQDAETFYSYSPSSKETKRVFYRYRIDAAAKRLKDTAKFYWAFFDDSNETDLHHVTIELHLPDNVSPDDLHLYLFDRSGGRITNVDNRTISYQTDFLPAYQDSEIHLLFPEQLLTEARYYRSEQSKEQLIQEAERQENRYSERGRLLSLAAKMDQFILVLILVGFGCLVLDHLFRRFRSIRAKITFADLAAADPLFISYLYRNGRLQENDFLAGLFSLYQKGRLKVEQVTANKRFLREKDGPKQTYLFTFIGNRADLTRYEQYLLDWLFQKQENRLQFRLDAIAGPTKTEQKNRTRVQNYRKKYQVFQSYFREWAQLLRLEQPFATLFRPSRLRKQLTIAMLIIHFLTVLFLLYADVLVTELWVFGIILAVLAFLSLWRFPRKRWMYGFFAVCFFAGCLISDDGAVTGSYLLATLLSPLLLAFIPSIRKSSEVLAYRAAIKKWRTQLAEGSGLDSQRADSLERLMPYAILLEVGPAFVRNVEPETLFADLLPWLPTTGLTPDRPQNKTAKWFKSKSDGGSSGDSGGSYDGSGNSNSGGDSGGGDSGGGGGADAF
nr:DUF2207 domain-containing protein [Brevibacillus fulvus]